RIFFDVRHNLLPLNRQRHIPIRPEDYRLDLACKYRSLVPVSPADDDFHGKIHSILFIRGIQSKRGNIHDNRWAFKLMGQPSPTLQREFELNHAPVKRGIELLYAWCID